MHWSQVAELEFDAPVSAECIAGIQQLDKAVEIAGGYISDLKFPVLLSELPDDLLENTARAADWFVNAEEGCHEFFPLIVALTLAAWTMNHAGQPATWLREAHTDAEKEARENEMIQAWRRVSLFVLCEQMRRRHIFQVMTLPVDPWDDTIDVVCEGRNDERMREFLTWLGYDES